MAASTIIQFPSTSRWRLGANKVNTSPAAFTEYVWDELTCIADPATFTYAVEFTEATKVSDGFHELKLCGTHYKL